MTKESYLNPDWNGIDKIHDWKNYISVDLANIWDTFTDEQKRIIAESADAISNLEKWF